MRRRAAVALLLALLALARPGAGTGTADGAEPPRGATADRAALDEIVRGGRVVTTPERPGVARYLNDLAGGVVDWLAARIERLAPGFAGLFESGAPWAAQAIFVLALGLLAFLLYRMGRDAYRRRRDRPSPVVPVAAPAGDETRGRSRQAWADELRRRLAAGDVAAACEALWWWLARTLVRGPVEVSWTSRELLARAGRRDLAPAVGRLDRMIYSAVAPAVDDVRRLWRDLEEEVG